MNIDPSLLQAVPPLVVAAFIAGCVDAMVGGGGLIQLPAMLLLLPGLPLPSILGTNKFSSVFGTSWAAWGYSRTEKFSVKILGPALLCAFAGAYLGARFTGMLHSVTFRPIILVLLVALAIVTAFRPRLGTVIDEHRHSARNPILTACLIAGPIGLYDGFFGPGTGTLVVFAFVWAMGWTFLRSSAIGKVINAGTNVAALVYFAHSHSVVYALGVPMAAANMAGSFCGVRLAVRGGSVFVRRVFLAVVVCLIVKLGFEMLTTAKH